MKPIIVLSLFAFIISCTTSVSQEPNEDLKREEEYFRVINQAKYTSKQTQEVQKAATEKTEEIINTAATTITSLKQEVKQLKQDLNEANEKLDSVISVNAELGRKFKLRPIPDSEENR